MDEIVNSGYCYFGVSEENSIINYKDNWDFNQDNSLDKNKLYSLFVKNLKNARNIGNVDYSEDYYIKLYLSEEMIRLYGDGLYPYYIFLNNVSLIDDKKGNIINSYNKCYNLVNLLNFLND
jgi:hypothetical protein